MNKHVKNIGSMVIAIIIANVVAGYGAQHSVPFLFRIGASGLIGIIGLVSLYDIEEGLD